MTPVARALAGSRGGGVQQRQANPSRRSRKACRPRPSALQARLFRTGLGPLRRTGASMRDAEARVRSIAQMMKSGNTKRKREARHDRAEQRSRDRPSGAAAGRRWLRTFVHLGVFVPSLRCRAFPAKISVCFPPLRLRFRLPSVCRLPLLSYCILPCSWGNLPNRTILPKQNKEGAEVGSFVGFAKMDEFDAILNLEAEWEAVMLACAGGPSPRAGLASCLSIPCAAACARRACAHVPAARHCRVCRWLRIICPFGC